MNINTILKELSDEEILSAMKMVNLVSKKECLMCNTKFEERINNKLASEIRKTMSEDKRMPICSLSLFSPEFLVHLQTTHGINHEDLDTMLEKIGIPIDELA